MHHHQRVDVIGNGNDIGFHALHVEQLAQFSIDHPALGRAASGRIEARPHRQVGHETHHRARIVGEAGNQLGQVVFEKGFLVRLEEWNRRRAVGGIAARQTEEERIAAVAQRNRLQARRGGAIFVFGKRLRIDDRQSDAATRARGHFLQQFLHARGIGADRGKFACGLFGVVEGEVDRLFDLGKDGLGAIGQRVELALREIQACAAEQRAAGHDECKKQYGQRNQRSTRGKTSSGKFHGVFLNRLS